MTLMSPNRRELMLAIPKTGGAARRMYFPKHGWFELKCKAQHHRLCDIERIFGIDPAACSRIYAVVRDPYEREISHYAHANQTDNEKGLGKKAAVAHESVNTWLWDWRGTPLWYYERGWYHDLYQHTADGSLEEYAALDGYRYWIMNRDGTIPDNVMAIPLRRQNEVLSECLGWEVEVPRINTSKHGNREEELDEHGADAVRRIYEWSFSHLKEALNGN